MLTLIQILKKIYAVFSTVLIDFSSLVSDTSNKSVNGRIRKVLIMLLCSTFGEIIYAEKLIKRWSKITHLSWIAAIANKDMSCSEASDQDL